MKILNKKNNLSLLSIGLLLIIMVFVIKNGKLGDNQTIDISVLGIGETIAITPTLTPTPIPDLTAPTIQITSPINGSRVAKGTWTNIYATANDNTGVSRVDFYVDGVLKSTDYFAPYVCNMWYIPKTRGVIYTIMAKAYDIVGNSSLNQITVTSK